MVFITEPNEVIEIDDDSSDDLQPWTPRHPARLQAINAPPIAQRHLPTGHEFQWDTAAVQAPPSPNANFDLDLDGGLLDQDFLNMEETVMMPAEPPIDVDITSGYDACLQEVLEIFPDISRDHVQHLYDAQLLQPRNGQAIAQHLITQILDAGKYPKEKDRLKELKRKRFADSDEEEVAYLKNLERNPFDSQYTQVAKLVLQEDFPDIPIRYIDLKYRETTQLFATYQALDRESRSWENSADRPYAKLKKPRTQRRSEDLSILNTMIPGGYGVEELKREIMAARRLRKKEDAKEQAKKDMSAAEAAREKEYRDRGDVLECGTCCDDLPTYKFTHCDGDNPHFLCFGCLQNYANTEIGNQRYALDCLHEDGCKATYSRKEKQRALDAKTFETLERLQQQAELKLANMTGLENCPFCDFAAICPPVKVDKEFRCGNPQCERISCRLCHKDSHIPLSCKEYKETFGVDERHAVEEAMTKALLKNCPKCGKQILKQDGCNKVVCFCGGMMCDYCGKDITKDGYNHFSGPGAGGMGNSKKCPTHDNTEQRRKAQVDAAQAEAIKKAREENPDLTEEQLKLKFSKAVEVESPWGIDPMVPGMPRPQAPNINALPQRIRHHIQHRLGVPPNPGDVPQMIPGAFPQQPFPQPYQQMLAGNAALHPQPQHGYVPQQRPPPPLYPGGFGIGFGNPPQPPHLTELQQHYLHHRAFLDHHIALGRQEKQGNAAAGAAPAPQGIRQHLDHPISDYHHQPNFGVGGGAVPGGADRHARRLALLAGLGEAVPPPALGGRRAAGGPENWNFGGENAGERRQRRQNR